MAWWKYAKPGDKVVCVYAATKRSQTERSLWSWNTKPRFKIGRIYQIESIHCDSSRSYKGCSIYIKVAGIYDYATVLGFKPLKSTKTGMSILKRIAKTAELMEDA